jgi:hypothetical protein
MVMHSSAASAGPTPPIQPAQPPLPVACPFCGTHSPSLRPPYPGTGNGHFYANCESPTCSGVGLYDYDAGIVTGAKSSMSFKFEARLLTGRDKTLRRVAALVRGGIDAAYFEKWEAAAVLIRVAGEGIAVRKILGPKRAIKGKPFGAQISEIKAKSTTLSTEFGIPPAKMRRVVRSLHYIREVGNRGAHFGARRGGPLDPNNLSVDLARQKIESILEDLYGW